MNTGYLLMQVAKDLRYELNQALIKSDLTIQQWAVLEQISLLTKTTQNTANLISKNLDMDKPTISGISKRLVVKELIQKVPNPADKRSQLLTLTENGQTALKLGQKISDQVLQKHLETLTATEQQQLQSTLKKINGDF
ncbi:MarR family winged helix-turn-helix transcriptional regulator [Companilactobacillus halodurans]|uniref:MarR family winged helix-turn-helix transcriptional regulator n=1 Tax=Companilactobacillus halodurans TaxID=2584183 RepID=UPI001EE2AA2E|nr:MarR family transcriptional regulator [Companilactobacillus halodurans]